MYAALPNWTSTKGNQFGKLFFSDPKSGAGQSSRAWTERVAEAITGKDYTTDYFSPLDQLRDMKKDGDYEGEGVIVGMQWNDGGHALQLEKIIDDPNDPPPRAVLHNPWGSNPGAKKGDQVPGAPPGVVWEDPEKGLVAWPLDDFEENLKYCFYPSDLDD